MESALPNLQQPMLMAPWIILCMLKDGLTEPERAVDTLAGKVGSGEVLKFGSLSEGQPPTGSLRAHFHGSSLLVGAVKPRFRGVN